MDGTDPEISRTIITSARTKAKEYNSTGPIVVCRLRHRQRIIQARERERARDRVPQITSIVIIGSSGAAVLASDVAMAT